MSKYDPFEAVSQLKSWIEKVISNLDQDNLQKEKERYRVVITTINNIKNLGMSVPDDLVLEKEKIEEIIQTEDVLKDLQHDLSLLATSIKQSLPKKSKARTQSGKKAARKILSVTFPDGVTFCENNATNTFLRSLEHIGLDKIADLEQIRSHGYPLVSKQKNIAANSLKMINGYYIETNSNTEQKAKELRLVAKQLQIDIKINVT